MFIKDLVNSPSFKKIWRTALYKGEFIRVVGSYPKGAYVAFGSVNDISKDFFPVFLREESGYLYGEIPIDDSRLEWITDENNPVNPLRKFAMYKGKKIYVHSKWKEEYYDVGHHTGNLPDDFFPSHVSQNKGETSGRIPVGDPDLIFLDEDGNIPKKKRKWFDIFKK